MNTNNLTNKQTPTKNSRKKWKVTKSFYSDCFMFWGRGVNEILVDIALKFFFL